MSWDSLIMKSQIATGEIMLVLLIPMGLDGVLLDVIVDAVDIDAAFPVIRLWLLGTNSNILYVPKFNIIIFSLGKD